MSSDSSAAPTKRDAYAVFRHGDFRLLFIARVLATTGEQMASVAMGWYLYEITNSELALGLVGLVQIIPVITLALPAGHIVDRYNRRWISVITYGLLVLLAFALFLLVQGGSGTPVLALIYLTLLGVGVLHTFNGPATATLLPQVVPENLYTDAATWSSNSWQFATILGPAIGGFIIAQSHSAAPVFLLEMVLIAIGTVLLWLIRSRQVPRPVEPITWASLGAGLRFILDTKIMLAAVTLDMFAVLLGGATALLPVYAKDILHVGAGGLGWLQAAPSIGAMLMSFLIVALPPFKQAGRTLLIAVTGFGIATIIFGLSTSFILSMAMLFLLGALDMISVVIRHALELIYTPDVMRGRVSAVHNVFIGTSNQLGAFESGSVASLFGPVAAVVSGGIGTILVVLWVSRQWPMLRRLGRMGEDVQS
ncbi:MAG: MFS transporter [Anaerolineae bacterium]|nr:MFS transporter [Anaerolineae bacterium]